MKEIKRRQERREKMREREREREREEKRLTDRESKTIWQRVKFICIDDDTE